MYDHHLPLRGGGALGAVGCLEHALVQAVVQRCVDAVQASNPNPDLNFIGNLNLNLNLLTLTLTLAPDVFHHTSVVVFKSNHCISTHSTPPVL